MYNIRTITESRWPQSSFKYQIVHKAIVRHNSKIIFNFEPNYNCQYHVSSSVDKNKNITTRSSKKNQHVHQLVSQVHFLLKLYFFFINLRAQMSHQRLYGIWTLSTPYTKQQAKEKTAQTTGSKQLFFKNYYSKITLHCVLHSQYTAN